MNSIRWRLEMLDRIPWSRNSRCGEAEISARSIGRLGKQFWENRARDWQSFLAKGNPLWVSCRLFLASITLGLSVGFCYPFCSLMLLLFSRSSHLLPTNIFISVFPQYRISSHFLWFWFPPLLLLLYLLVWFLSFLLNSSSYFLPCWSEVVTLFMTLQLSQPL